MEVAILVTTEYDDGETTQVVYTTLRAAAKDLGFPIIFDDVMAGISKGPRTVKLVKLVRE